MKERTGNPLTTGYTTQNRILYCADILMLWAEELDDAKEDDLWLPICHEYVLVHELLHVRFPMYTRNGELSGPESWADDELHHSIDATARALVAAKYGIPLDWFIRR